MESMTPTDKIRTRTVNNRIRLIREHLEAIQRDYHGIEYDPWKREIDALWKNIFDQINRMSVEPQRQALDTIKDLWMIYITHYAVIDK